MVVARVQPQIYAAFQDQQESLRANIDSVYDKLQRIEPQVSAALVQHVAGRLSAVIDQMPGSELPPIFDNHRTKILDGKHLNGTQRRLKELRKFTAVPLPRQWLVVLDAQRMLACGVVPCEDAQERALVETVLPTVQPGEVWIEDRNFCTTRFLFGVADRGGCFVVWLRLTAARVKLHFYPKSKRGPKKKTHRAVPFGRHRHVSTARILATTKPKTSQPQGR